MTDFVNSARNECVATDAEAMRDLGRQLSRVVEGGDVILLVGPLGAGKTTFVQGLGSGMQVEGKVTSPTYIIARVHDSTVGGPDLVHVDAYRLEDDLDLETIDLDAGLDESVTVVEWGRGRAEELSDDRLEIEITFTQEPSTDEATEQRAVRFVPVGARWARKLKEADLV